jgi:hypothetical protein
MRAMLWISAVWRSGSRAMMRSPKDFRRRIFASIRLRAWYPVQRFQSETGPWPQWGRVSPSNPPVVSRRAQDVVAGAWGRAVFFPKTSVLSDRDDRTGVAFDDGLVAAACVVGAVGGDRAYLLVLGDLAEQVGQQVRRAICAAIRDLDGQGLLPAAQRGKVWHGPVAAGWPPSRRSGATAT